jgi:hypothetical protein
MSSDSRTSTPAPTDAVLAQQSYDQLKATFFAQCVDVCFALRCILRAQWTAGIENKPTVLMVSDQECDQFRSVFTGFCRLSLNLLFLPADLKILTLCGIPLNVSRELESMILCIRSDSVKC